MWVFGSLSETGGEGGKDRDAWGAEQRPFWQLRRSRGKAEKQPFPKFTILLSAWREAPLPAGAPAAFPECCAAGALWRAHPEAHPPHPRAIFSS